MWFDVAFGKSKQGLSTVGYRQYDNTGVDAVVRTTTGVVAIGHGAYGADITLNASAVGIEWDTGEGSPLYAIESVVGEVKVDSILNLLEGDHDEAYNHITIFKKGTPIKILDKDISGSLLTPGVTITTREP